MKFDPQFRITFGIEKAEQRADGYYITGIASGLGVDTQGEEMDPSAIVGFSKQIADRVAKGDPILYMDAHKRDGVLSDLGWVTKGWVTEDFELGIEVKLDVEDNPAAMSLYQKVRKGKQYGMSVAGRVNKYIDQFRPEIGKSVRRFFDVTLSEISNTTRPIWTPSFGTVLSKAVDEAGAESHIEEGTSSMKPEAPAAEQVPVADAEKSESAPADALVADDTTEKGDAEVVAEDAEKAAPEAPADVEKAGRALSGKNISALLAMRATIDATLTELGALEAPPATGDVTPTSKSVSEDEGDNLAKAVSDATAPLLAVVEDLRKSLTEATARITELENTPAGDGAPALIDKADIAHEAAELIAKASPSDLIRLGLTARQRS